MEELKSRDGGFSVDIGDDARYEHGGGERGNLRWWGQVLRVRAVEDPSALLLDNSFCQPARFILLLVPW